MFLGGFEEPFPDAGSAEERFTEFTANGLSDEMETDHAVDFVKDALDVALIVNSSLVNEFGIVVVVAFILVKMTIDLKVKVSLLDFRGLTLRGVV